MILGIPNVIDLKFDEDTQTWVEENLMPQISDIDNQIKEIENEQNIKDSEFAVFSSLLERTRNLITEVQECI